MSIIPSLSPTAGVNADGFADCQVNETLLTAEMATVERCNDLVIYRLDRSTGLNVIPVTVGTTFYPFGDATAFSSGDSFVIGCPEDTQAILYNCDVAGVHNGTLKVFDSTNGSWASNELVVTDEGNAFRSTGWHYILTPDNASKANWRPSIDPTLNAPSLKYFLLELSGIISGNTPPRITDIVLVRKTFRWMNHTADVNGDTATAPASDTHYSWTNSIKIWCFTNSSYRLEVYMHLVQTNVITDVHEYLAADNTWKAVTGWNNATDDFTIGPTVLGNPVQKLSISWSIPVDWASMPQTFTLDDGTTQSITGYWIRERTTGVTTYGIHNSPRYRLRARQFGNANVTGQQIFGAKTLQGVSILTMTNINTASMSCEVVNLTTGKATAFTISANPTLPLNLDVTDLAFANGDMRGIRCISGGSATGVQLEYAY